jgi:hypothetical protein
MVEKDVKSGRDGAIKTLRYVHNIIPLGKIKKVEITISAPYPTTHKVRKITTPSEDRFCQKTSVDRLRRPHLYETKEKFYQQLSVLTTEKISYGVAKHTVV